MALGTRKQREQQEDLWIAHRGLASAPGHPFYKKLNQLLEARFDEFVESRNIAGFCWRFYWRLPTNFAFFVTRRMLRVLFGVNRSQAFYKSRRREVSRMFEQHLSEYTENKAFA